MAVVKDKKKSDKKNGCFGCLGCLGLLFIIAILFSSCVALFGTEEEPKPEEETVQDDQPAVKAEEERKELEERETEAKEKAEVEKKEKEEAERVAEIERIAKEEAEQEEKASADKECGDFSSPEDVLEFWISNGYSAENDPHELDRDSDGLPCEVSQSEYDNFGGNDNSPDVTKTEETPPPKEEPKSNSNINISYDNCTDVRAAGAAPIRIGDPGYGSHLDRDGDGIACET